MSKESEAGEEGVHPVRSMKKASVPETEREAGSGPICGDQQVSVKGSHFCFIGIGKP